MNNLLVKEYRAGIMECAHNGHICIVNEEAKVAASSGNPEYVTFTRSSAKPFQAIPGIRAGIARHFGLTGPEIAVMVSSHRGEKEHQQILQSMLKKIGIDEEQLVCASSYPLNSKAKEELLRNNGHHRKLYHNCAGKHLGILAYCRMMGYPLNGYEDPSHPVQREILDIMAEMSGLPKEEIKLGTDGCGLPVFALPLRGLATAYMKLAYPEAIADRAAREAVLTITEAMNGYPNMVGGTGRIDTVLLQDSNITAKGGFKGVFCFGLKKERLGAVIKIADGSEEEWGLIATSILEQLGYENAATIERLRASFTGVIYNDAGREVGHSETVFKLEFE